jgi:hypothetical protein
MNELIKYLKIELKKDEELMEKYKNHNSLSNYFQGRASATRHALFLAEDLL